MIWEGWLEVSGSSIAALITSIAALIASIAALRRSSRNGKGTRHGPP